MENEELTSGAEAGATGESSEMQGADQSSQESRQDQSSDSTQVESGESQASSRSQQARSNLAAAERRLSSRELRLIENAIEKRLSSALDSKLNPLLERLQAPSPSAAPSKGDEIDFNDLPGSIKRIIEAQLGQKVNPSKLKEEIFNEIQTKSTRQEARKFLVSQQDIGNDAAKHQEIQDLIANDKLLYHSVSEYPVEVMQEAVKRWRSSRTNPMAPSKAELGTVSGGMGVSQRSGSNPIQRIKEISDKLMSPTITIEEKEKLNREFDSLVSSFK